MAVVVAMTATTLMFFVLFKVLARPPTPDRALWQGALLGSVAFEVLKQLSSVLLAATHRSPAFQAFGIALILLVWINYFSRVVMYAAAWAHTSGPASRDTESTPPLSSCPSRRQGRPVPGRRQVAAPTRGWPSGQAP